MIKHFIGAVAVILSLSACQTTSNIEPEYNIIGEWRVDSVQSNTVTDYSSAKLIFAENGKLTGNTSCNGFFGQYQITGKQLTLTSDGLTRKACIEALMQQEQQVLQTLPLVNQIQMINKQLHLLDQSGNTIMVLTGVASTK
ncbi:META domain-containing protein [Shewanella aestuarii]|uniref:META domain-containing protein n=1 Tax=Shewanella aestuarii TaxID=1028752 RepID=A0A6G9QLW3_9GAMM|nr:META domain-containing protein [Shewanella aestuarii]QIR15536.1 META domain-containing protein [Shewanella aestuarii]